MENWRSIAGYEGIYEISDHGNVKSLNYNHTGKPKLLAPKVGRLGYVSVMLCKGGSNKNMSVHILVARAFIENPEAKTQVNHIDGDKQNNNVWNLEWVTPSENVQHSFKFLGKRSPNKGRFGGLHYAAVPVSQYRLDGCFVQQWDCISDAARSVGCNPSQIINNIKGRTKTCHGYMWRYERVERIDTFPVTSRKTHKKAGL